jgi:hypothetical protein
VTLLLDATDRRLRLLQHGAIFGAVGLLALASRVVDANFGWGIAIILAGLTLVAVASRAVQRWEVDYRGHRIEFRNNPLSGEKLFIDGALAAKGTLGVTSVMRATIPSGDGMGDEIVARTKAGLTQFHCRIEAVSASGLPVSDDQLLAEVRRRGLV